jgi:hypothetical protein
LSLATAADANTWLDQSKLSMASGDVAEIAPKIDAEVIAALLNLFPTNAPLWLDGSQAPPVVVVDVASRLYAAAFYARKYSEETMQPNSYAERLKADAYAIITQIQNNDIALVDPTSGLIIVASSALDEMAFWPNDTDIVQPDENGNMPPGLNQGDPDIAFSRDMVF